MTPFSIWQLYPFVRVIGWDHSTGKWRFRVKAWSRRA